MLVTIDKFLNADELSQMHAHLESGEWNDGRLTAGGLAGSKKNNQQLDDHSDLAISLANFLLERLGNHPQFVSAAIPHRIHPPRFNRYAGGESYGVHVDAPIMSMPHSNEVLRSDVSATLFLNNPEDYDGGELVVETEFGSQQVKLNAGDMVLYPSSSLHQVLPVTRGERVCAILWAQSMVPDVSARAILFDLDQSIQALTAEQRVDQDELMRLTAVYHNLVRRWAQV
ncbi:Fe2+-dependent dioxygenase [Arenicella xantha]|uniref:PKHD-type hydroxylase n=1 Tax=Arenicella xantha TaxID=644221 RepID=A0A395JJD4_9GAMM|nr:Fe2+-dependent dioxygenase [Arenicella xantha]RBP48878.1 PKHD-type hydroxylase [Arenicella xantha]